MVEIPDQIVLKRHRDLVGRRHEAWIRRSLLVLVAAVVVVGLLNVFGQRPAVTRVSGRVATLEIYAPSRVRGGLLYEARFRIEARQEIEKATLVLDRGWMEGMTINTIEPSPLGEASRDGKLALDLGHVPAGHSFVLYLQFQVNPTNVGHRSQTVELDDDATPLVTIDRTITVFP